MWDDAQRKDTIVTDTNELVMYLSHCKKPDHVATVMDLTRRLASTQETLNKRDEELRIMRALDQATAMHHPSGEQILRLPPSARKVSIEL